MGRRGGPHADGREFPLGALPLGRRDDELPRALGAAYGGDLATARAEIARAPLTRDQVALMQSDNVASPHLPGLAELGIQPTPIDAVLQQFRGQD